jgi:hypothetical protein
LIVCLSLLIGAYGTSFALTEDATSFSQINRSFLEGRITLDERALLDITAIRNPSALPAEYRPRTTSGSRLEVKCVTDVLTRVLVADWPQLSPPTQQAISEAMTRRSTAFTYNSPGGFFKLHYDITGTHAVPSTDGDLSGVPDFVEKVAAYMDTSLADHQVRGYLDPPSDGALGGDSLFDVYFENMSYYGYAVPEGPGSNPWNDYYSHLVMNNDFIGFPANTDPEGNQAGAAKATAAHEFHHCVQFAYDANEPSWFMELDATYMEDIVFDQVNDNYNYLDDYFNSPQTSLMNESIHMYSSFIWGMYLAQNFDTSLMTSVWEGARFASVFNSLSDSLLINYGWTQDSAFADFAVWNFMTSTRDDGQHHQEAAFYPAMTIASTFQTYPVNWQSVAGGASGYAANYVQFKPGINEGQLTVDFNGVDNQQWAAFVIISSTVNTHTVQQLTLDPTTKEGRAIIEHFDDYYAVTLVGVNLSEFGGASLFTYAASLRDPYALAAYVVTDSAIYSGDQREFTIRVYNPSELSDVVDVSISDNLGWAVVDTVDKFIAAGDSVDVTFTVIAPEATPLGTQSVLTFLATSRSDSLVWAEQQLSATTMLQRGDVNFSGQVTLTDVTYLVNYMFASGSAPIPTIDAADLNCSGTISLTDLTYMVNMLFIGGPPVPCNPY